MISLYHMILFSDFDLSVETKYYSGYSFVGFMGLMLLVNLALIAYKSVEGAN